MTTETPSAINRADQLRIRRAIAHMPFAADSRVHTPGRRLFAEDDPVTADGLVEFLETLAPVLREAGERASAESRELAALRADLAALRRVLGTAD